MTPHSGAPRPTPRHSGSLRPWAAAALAVALLAGACGNDSADSNEVGSAAGSDPTTANDTTSGNDPTTANDTTSGNDTASAQDGEAGGAPVAFEQVPLALQPIVTINQPIALAPVPGDDDLVIAERQGRLRLVERTIEQDGALERVRLRTAPLLDISDLTSTDSERGLLGLAFAPDGDQIYLHYTDSGGDNVIAAYTVTTGPDGIAIDTASARRLLTIDQPFSNHNGGDLLFGPDGMLYITVGDGGGSGDPELTGQDPTDLLGSILRIDPRPGNGEPYTIPEDNPFVAGGGAPEVWVWGARNPWRSSFDPATGDLWVADVGQDAMEEINHLPAAEGGGRGANLGWNLMEGNERFAGDPPPDHVPPVHTYEHDNGRCSVTGGYVHRGPDLASLNGVYIFGDFCSGELFGLHAGPDGAYRAAPLAVDRRADNVIAFGQDNQGEVYVLLQGGQVSRLADPASGVTVEVVAGD